MVDAADAAVTIAQVPIPTTDSVRLRQGADGAAGDRIPLKRMNRARTIQRHIARATAVAAIVVMAHAGTAGAATPSVPGQGYGGADATTTTLSPATPIVQQTPDAMIDVSVDGFQPGSKAKGTLRSDPVALGDFVADAKGVVRVNVPLPADVTPGDHKVIVEGIDPTAHRAPPSDRSSWSRPRPASWRSRAPTPRGWSPSAPC